MTYCAIAMLYSYLTPFHICSAFLKYLGLSSPENVDDQDLEEDDICEADKVRRDLFMGYLLKLVTSGNTGRMPVHSLPILSAHLQSKNLLPRWVQWIVTQRPALFNRAFSKLFAQVCGIRTAGRPFSHAAGY